MFLNATTAFGGVVIVGTGIGATKRISEAYHEGDKRHLASLARSLLAIATCTGFLLSLMILAYFGFYAPRGQFLSVGIAAALVAFIDQIDSAFTFTLKGAELFSLAARVDMGSKLIQISAAIIALHSGFGVKGVFVVLVIAGFCRPFIKFVAVKTKMELVVYPPTTSEVRSLLGVSVWGWLQGISGGITIVSDRFFVGVMLGPSMLTAYSLALMIPQQLQVATTTALSFLFPKVSRETSQNRTNSRSIKRLVFRILLVQILFGITLLVTLIAFKRQFFEFWLGRDLGAEFYVLFDYLAWAYFFLALNAGSYYVLMGIGKIRLVSLIVASSGLISVPLTFFGIKYFGLTGASFGKVVYAFLTLSLLLPVFLLKKVSVPAVFDRG